MSNARTFELTPQAPPIRRLYAEVWSSRSLIRLLARQSFFARYRRASLGLLWAVGMPLVQALVLALVFSGIARVDTPGNYGVFVFVGTVPWNFFISGVTGGSTSIVDGSALTSKTYFPRAVLPIVSVLAEAYGLVCSLLVMLLAVVILGPGLNWHVLLLVPALALVLVMTVSFATLLAAVHVYFRDTKYLVRALAQAWFFVTPVMYPLTFVDGILRRVVEINPASGMILLFRAAIFPVEPGWTVALWWSLAWTAVCVAVASVVHARFNRVFVDLL